MAVPKSPKSITLKRRDMPSAKALKKSKRGIFEPLETANWVQWKKTGGLRQKHKKQPFCDASASHLSLVLWHV